MGEAGERTHQRGVVHPGPEPVHVGEERSPLPTGPVRPPLGLDHALQVVDPLVGVVCASSPASASAPLRLLTAETWWAATRSMAWTASS